MKVARFHSVRPVQTISELFNTSSPGPSGQVLTSTGSNSSSVAWGSNVATITSNGSNVLVGPYVGLQSGTGIAFAASSNILTISSTVTGAVGGSGTSGFVGAKVYATATQSIPSSTETALTFDSEEFDTDAFHSTSANTSRFTIPTGLAGKYRLHAGGFANSGGSPQIFFKVNGTTNVRGSAEGVNDTYKNASAVIELAVGDYIEVIAYQSSGGALSWGHASSLQDQWAFSIQYLGTGSSSSSSTFAPSVVSWTVIPFASTNSLAGTIPAAASGNRLIVAISSYNRDITSVTCTNVTFTEVLSAIQGTAAYLSVYVGVVAGGSSGTTLTIAAGSSDNIFATVIEVKDALTPTVINSATKTGTSATTDQGKVVGPITTTAGNLLVFGFAVNNAAAVTAMEFNGTVFLLPGDSVHGLRVAIGSAGSTSTAGYWLGGPNANYAAGIVAVS